MFRILQDILERYNENKSRMNLVLFDDALDHLTRVHRIIRIDRGHALLVGVGSSGKQSITKLAAFAAGCEVGKHNGCGQGQNILGGESILQLKIKVIRATITCSLLDTTCVMPRNGEM